MHDDLEDICYKIVETLEIIKDRSNTRKDNLKRMEKGRAPIGYDGDPIELHHLIQSESGSVVEISGSMHRENHKTLHINTSDIPSGINRSSFQMLRSAYWKRRAQTLRKEMRK